MRYLRIRSRAGVAARRRVPARAAVLAAVVCATLVTVPAAAIGGGGNVNGEEEDPLIHTLQACVELELAAAAAFTCLQIERTDGNGDGLYFACARPLTEPPRIQIFDATENGIVNNVVLPNTQIVDLLIEFDGTDFRTFAQPRGNDTGLVGPLHAPASGSPWTQTAVAFGVTNLNAKAEVAIECLTLASE